MGDQKVDVISLNTFKMKDKKKKFRFFVKILLLAKLSMNIILRILFLILSNIKINFIKFEFF